MFLRRFCVSANQLVDTTCFVGRVGCYNLHIMYYKYIWFKVRLKCLDIFKLHYIAI